MRIDRRFQIPVLLLGIFASRALPQPAEQSDSIGLELSGDVPNPLHLKAGQLAALPHRSVQGMEHGGAESTWEGVPVSELLRQAGVPTGGQFKGKWLSAYLVVSARDGYQVVFSLAELESSVRDSDVIVADRHAGKPMVDPEGPLRLVAASDKKPARSVRMLQSLRVVLAK